MVAERFICAVHGFVPRSEVEDSAQCGRVHNVPVGQPHTLDTGEPCFSIGLPAPDLEVRFTPVIVDPELARGPQG
jgi:hypothetical protein